MLHHPLKISIMKFKLAFVLRMKNDKKYINNINKKRDAILFHFSRKMNTGIMKKIVSQQ